MTEEFFQLLTRIDERTQNMEARQTEEIAERKDLDKRVNFLENWRNFIGGGMAVISVGAAAGFQYLLRKINGH